MTKPFGHFWETVHQASGEPLISKEWLAEKLAACHDDAIGASQPKRPCDTPPGCNAGNCLRCGEVKPTAELELAFIQAALNLAQESAAHAFSIPVPNTTPQLFVSLHEGEIQLSNPSNEQGRVADVAVSGKQQVIDALYAAWMREPVGETIGAIGNAIQYLQSEASQPPSASPVAVPMTNDQWHALVSAADALDYLVKDGTYGDVAVRHSATIRSMLAAPPALPDAGLDSQIGTS